MIDAGRRDATAQPRPLIACMGEMLVDFLPITERGEVVGFRMHPGGSLLNVAVTIARLGGRAALVTKSGRDLFGRYLLDRLGREGVDTRWIADSQALTALGFVGFVDGEPDFTFYGEGTADTLVAADELPDELFAEVEILHVGSISLLRGTTPTAVAAACERLRDRALLSLDPNVRPSMVEDETAYRASLERLVAMVDIVKVSAADLAWLAPGRDPVDYAMELAGRGPILVAVTRGADGTVAVRRSGGAPSVIALPRFAVTIADAVGAGDSFSGGLLTRLGELNVTSREALGDLSDDDLAAALRFSGAVAALDCTRPGADPPTRAEVDAFLAAPSGARR